jgi:FkbM family methyltransferase
MANIMNDPYWSNTIDFLRKHISSGETLIAPDELRSQFHEAIVPSGLLHVHELDDSCKWVVIHKGRLSEFNYVLLESIVKEFYPVFANEVFIVLSPKTVLASVDLKSPHFISFKEALTALGTAEVSPGKVSSESSSLRNRKIVPANMTRFNPIQNVSELASMARHDIEVASRANSQNVYLGNETLLCRVLGKYMMYCDTEDGGIVPHLCLNGYWEIWITMVMAQTVKVGWYCIDIGANHGYYTLIMADAVGPSGRVLALEPNPPLVNLLNKTLSVNGLQDRTEVLQKAISNTSGESVKLVIPQGRGLNGSICANTVLESDRVFEVETITTDDLTKGWPRVDFIKIDAEGAELQIWQGLTATIHNNQNITIILEFNCGRYANPKGFLQDILNVGFKLKHIDYDAKVKNLTIDQCLAERPNEDWMLFLHR